MNLWDKLTKAVVFLLFVAGLLGVCVWYLPLIRQNQRMRQEMLHLDGQIQKEEEIDKNLRASLEFGRNDPKTIERLARTHLGYAFPGEVIIRFESPSTVTNVFRR